MPTRYTARLLAHIEHDVYTPANEQTLAQDLGVPAEGREEFAQTIAQLRDDKVVLVDKNGLVTLPGVGEFVTGVFRKNARGFGFILPDRKIREGDIFIPPDAVADALSGDTVKAKIVRRRDEMSGVIVEVLQRKRARFSGELTDRKGGQWLVIPDGKELTQPVVVRDPQSKNAKPGDKVVVQITAYPEGDYLPEGVIVEVLGAAGEPSVETQAVIATYDLPGPFSERVFAQASRAAEQFQRDLHQWENNQFHGREDLREEFIITIDPPDAKDYDDAIHIARTGEGGWKLGVHIADVAHFIPMGSPLDEEAKKRGNSCYLPRHVIPMLPEVLSNGVCSLQEGVPRFCKTAFMEYSREGNLLRSGVASTCIHSHKRLTYLEAQALIDGDEAEARKHAKTEPNYSERLVGTLREMDACARAIRSRRRSMGMIHLELPDVDLVFDDNGRVIDAQREDDAFTHTIIEMFMVEANEVLARVFERVKVPLLRRVHPEPVPGNVDNLQKITRVAGMVIPKSPTRMELQKLLDSTAGTPAAAAVHMAVLRTLTRASYSPQLIGHFALASDAYAHFTSPIRRYADLTVHRALAEYLRLSENGSRPPKSDVECKKLGDMLRESKHCPPFEDLEQIGKHITHTEEIAAGAESDLRQFLVLQLLCEHLGEDFSAMVTGVTQAGVFVKLEKYLAEGLIKTPDLPPGEGGKPNQWRIDARTGALVNAGSGRSFSIGDKLNVTIAKIELNIRRMDLVVSDPASRDKGKTRKLYPKRGYDGQATPTGPVAGLNLGNAVAGPRSDAEWKDLKYGKSGSASRSQRSKQRGKGKNQRRDH